MGEMTLDQQRAIATANARLRLAGGQEQQTISDVPQLAAQANDPEVIAANPLVRFAMGAASPILGLAQLQAHLGGFSEPIDSLVSRLETMKESGRAKLGSEGFDAPSFAGTVMSPAVLKVAQALKPAATVLGKAAQGAVVGGGFGASAPVTSGEDFASEKTKQVGTGAVLGGVLSPAAAAVAKAYQAAKGFVTNSAAKMAARATGDKTDDVVQALMTTRSQIPGVNLTAGQASVPANSAEFAALQELAASHNPSAYAGPAGIEGRQEAARLAAIRTVGKDKAALEAADAARSAAATRDYGAAYQQAIKADPQLMKMSENPYFKDALPDAIKLAEAKGISPKTDLTQFLHFVKISLDKQLGRTGDTALANTERQAVETLKKQVVGWLGEKNPAYETARANYAAASQPINRMEVGQSLEKALTSPLSGGERPSSFANAVREAPRTIKRATGQSRFESLDQVLSPQETAMVDALMGDLKRNAAYGDLAKAGKASMEERIKAFELPPTGFFAPLVSAGRSWVNRVSGGYHEKTLRELSDLMAKDPQRLAQMMQGLSQQQKKVAEALLARIATAGTAATAASQ